MSSFNFWSSCANAGREQIDRLASRNKRGKQQLTLERLEAKPRAGAITKAELLRLWQTPKTLTPLALYIENMPVMARRSAYEVRVSAARSAAWVR